MLKLMCMCIYNIHIYRHGYEHSSQVILFGRFKGHFDHKIQGSLRFYLDLARALKEIQTEKKQELHEQAWWCKGMFEQCFDPDFQRKAVQLVTEDQSKEEYKYFGKMEGGGLPLDPVINSLPTAVMKVVDAHDAIEQLESPEVDARCPPAQLIDRELKPIEIAGGARPSVWCRSRMEEKEEDVHCKVLQGHSCYTIFETKRNM